MRLALALALALCGVASRAHAQQDPTPPIGGAAKEKDRELDKAKAATLLNGGNALFEKGDYIGALAKYEQAYATYPSAKIFFNIAEAHNKLDHPVEAADAYERFLAEANVDPASGPAKKVQERLDGLKPRIALVEAFGEPTGADIVVDGKAIGSLPMKPVRVKAGKLALKASMPGYSAYEATIDAPGGQTTPIEIKLTLESVAARDQTPDIGAAPVAITEAPGDEGGGGGVTSKWWFWGAVGLGVVAAGTAVALAATSGGSDFVPTGELGASSTASWTRF
ncbi:PEGA domain-containing protein [Myxococcota bacterium]|nr:PEGA domain-containing protein [Myxococcota bacterium]